MDEGCLKDFNYESICRLIKAKKESEYQAHRKAVVTELKRIFETVKYNVERGDANAAFKFEDKVDIEIRKDVVKELCARFPERVAFWYEYEKRYALIHTYPGEPPVVRDYRIVFNY